MLLHSNLLLRLCLQQASAGDSPRAPLNCEDARRSIRNFIPGLTEAPRHCSNRVKLCQSRNIAWEISWWEDSGHLYYFSQCLSSTSASSEDCQSEHQHGRRQQSCIHYITSKRKAQGYGGLAEVLPPTLVWTCSSASLTEVTCGTLGHSYELPASCQHTN